MGDRTGSWYIDQNGDRAFDGTFRNASSFFKGLANVEFKPSDVTGRGETFAYIDNKGRRIFSY